jgi:hypothetical protein
MGGPADRFCWNDRSGVESMPGAQTDAFDLKRLANA